MANVPMLPTGPSRQDVDSMRRLRQIMDGGSNVPATSRQQIHEGVHSGGQYRTAPQQPAYNPSAYMGGYAPADVNGMKETLERFYAAQGGKDTYKAMESDRTPMSQKQLTETVSESRAVERQVTGGSYEARTRLEEMSNGKTRKRYDVVDTGSRSFVFENFVNQETAQALAKLLNRGLSESDKKVIEVLELEEEFNKCRSDAARFKKHYTRSVELGETEAGAVFAKRFKTAKAEALAAQESLKSINDSLR